MQRITKKDFINFLYNHSNIFCGSLLNKTFNNDILCEKINSISAELLNTAEKRTIKECHSNYIKFSNDSKLYFDNAGTKEYYLHINGNYTFLIQKTVNFDFFDNIERYNYIVYAI